MVISEGNSEMDYRDGEIVVTDGRTPAWDINSTNSQCIKGVSANEAIEERLAYRISRAIPSFCLRFSP
jgi:hypothetical protein